MGIYARIQYVNMYKKQMNTHNRKQQRKASGNQKYIFILFFCSLRRQIFGAAHGVVSRVCLCMYVSSRSLTAALSLAFACSMCLNVIGNVWGIAFTHVCLYVCWQLTFSCLG